ncbi:hypothetical protein [Aquipuribacter sp. MA13-6]|uniref:hypothetical protein n=1 Tax=unclassified Aquipuribacter TaxID=2635084 RepID=UPI003EEB3ACC
MRRTISGAAIAVLASATLLAGCADDSADTDPAVDDPAVEDTMEPMDDATMDDMATMEPTDG